MKQGKSVWGSISILVGVLLPILALVRGTWEIVLLIAAFTAWGLWVILTQLRPVWRAERETQQRVREAQAVQAELEAANVPNLGVAQTLLRHVNHRISAQIKSAYPDARWEWAVKNPALLAVQGGIGRIRVYGVNGFDYADVELDPNGNLVCSLIQFVPNQQPASGAAPAPEQQPLDPQIWYEKQGRETLEALVADLDSRGYKHLVLHEDGSISAQGEDSGAGLIQSTFDSFPPKVYWPRLAKVLEQEGLAATVQDDCVSVAW